MQKLIAYSIDDIAYDARAISDALSKACTTHTQHYTVRGVCQVGRTVYFVLVPLAGSGKLEDYIMVDVPDLSDDGFTSMLAERWDNGFSTIGTINLGEDSYVVLFARPRDDG